ncbi:unnamed protein product [Orchesella dallaii]|uniref:Uncharacterized protein n=1 Tax=Orchesella dallaii TaxID=48710 RepID=A0ABP1QPE4_9HEXA
MESRRSTALARPRVVVQPNRGVRRRLFSPRGGRVMVARRRAAGVPIQPTPHLPNAAQFFMNVHQQDDQFGNNDVVLEAENRPVGAQEAQEDIPRVELDGAGGQNYARAVVSRKQRRKRVVVPTGISNRPNLKKALLNAKELIKKAEKDVREIAVHQVCATKKKYGWGQILERVQTLLCTLARASNQNGLNQREMFVFKKLETVNELVNQLVSKFEDELESQRKTLKMEREVGSRKRSCCLVCHHSNKA